MKNVQRHDLYVDNSHKSGGNIKATVVIDSADNPGAHGIVRFLKKLLRKM